MEHMTKVISLLENGLGSRIISSVLILLGGLILMKVATYFMKKVLKRSALDAALYTFIINTARVLMWVVLIITLLSNLGVPTTTFITVVGACGAAIALALKDSLSNFAGGVLIIVNKPFEKGDYIETAGIGGKVEKIDLLYSTLVTLDNKVISIPNGKLSSDVVVNFSRADRRRVDTKFSIGYNDDIGQAKAVIRSIIKKANLFFDDPEPTIGVSSYGDNAVEIEVLAWCKTENYYPAKYYLQEEVKKAFDKNGIEIPYPQLVIHMGEDSVPAGMQTAGDAATEPDENTVAESEKTAGSAESEETAETAGTAGMSGAGKAEQAGEDAAEEESIADAFRNILNLGNPGGFENFGKRRKTGKNKKGGKSKTRKNQRYRRNRRTDVRSGEKTQKETGRRDGGENRKETEETGNGKDIH